MVLHEKIPAPFRVRYPSNGKLRGPPDEVGPNGFLVILQLAHVDAGRQAPTGIRLSSEPRVEELSVCRCPSITNGRNGANELRDRTDSCMFNQKSSPRIALKIGALVQDGDKAFYKNRFVGLSVFKRRFSRNVPMKSGPRSGVASTWTQYR